MKIRCQRHGYVEGRFVGPDLLCSTCLDEPMLLAMANLPEREADIVTGSGPRVSTSISIQRDVPTNEPDINGIED